MTTRFRLITAVFVLALGVAAYAGFQGDAPKCTCCDPCSCEDCTCDPCTCDDCECGVEAEACACDPCTCDPCACGVV